MLLQQNIIGPLADIPNAVWQLSRRHFSCVADFVRTAHDCVAQLNSLDPEHPLYIPADHSYVGPDSPLQPVFDAIMAKCYLADTPQKCTVVYGDARTGKSTALKLACIVAGCLLPNRMPFYLNVGHKHNVQEMFLKAYGRSGDKRYDVAESIHIVESCGRRIVLFLDSVDNSYNNFTWSFIFNVHCAVVSGTASRVKMMFEENARALRCIGFQTTLPVVPARVESVCIGRVQTLEAITAFGMEHWKENGARMGLIRMRHPVTLDLQPLEKEALKFVSESTQRYAYSPILSVPSVSMSHLLHHMNTNHPHMSYDQVYAVITLLVGTALSVECCNDTAALIGTQ